METSLLVSGREACFKASIHKATPEFLLQGCDQVQPGKASAPPSQRLSPAGKLLPTTEAAPTPASTYQVPRPHYHTRPRGQLNPPLVRGPELGTALASDTEFSQHLRHHIQASSRETADKARPCGP